MNDKNVYPKTPANSEVERKGFTTPVIPTPTENKPNGNPNSQSPSAPVNKPERENK